VAEAAVVGAQIEAEVEEVVEHLSSTQMALARKMNHLLLLPNLLLRKILYLEINRLGIPQNLVRITWRLPQSLLKKARPQAQQHLPPLLSLLRQLRVLFLMVSRRVGQASSHLRQFLRRHQSQFLSSILTSKYAKNIY